MLTTDGHLLGGRILYRQPATGFRTGIEPVLLAASVPAVASDDILEAGTGAGAAILCLHLRVPGIRLTGVEIDEATARLAAENVCANHLQNIEIVTGRIETAALGRLYDHAIANPPYHAPDGTGSPLEARVIAKQGSAALIMEWVGKLARVLRDRGTLTLIVPPTMVSSCLTAMTDSRCPCTMLFPLWPKAGRMAKLVLLRGVKGTRTPMRLSAGLVLHASDGSYTDAAQAILRDGCALVLDR